MTFVHGTSSKAVAAPSSENVESEVPVWERGPTWGLARLELFPPPDCCNIGQSMLNSDSPAFTGSFAQRFVLKWKVPPVALVETLFRSFCVWPQMFLFRWVSVWSASWRMSRACGSVCPVLALRRVLGLNGVMLVRTLTASWWGTPLCRRQELPCQPLTLSEVNASNQRLSAFHLNFVLSEAALVVESNFIRYRSVTNTAAWCVPTLTFKKEGMIVYDLLSPS